MSSWNNNIGISKWPNNTNNNNINSNQLISSIIGLGTAGYISSSQFLSTNSVFISLFSTLFGSTITGDTALWASYPALTSVNLNNHDIGNVRLFTASNIYGVSNTSTSNLNTNIISSGIINVSSINVNSINSLFINNTLYNGDTINTSELNAIIISSSQIYTSSISTGFLSLSTIGGVYGKYLSTTLGNLSNASTTTDNVKNWANYKAITDVNFDYHNGYNLANTQTNSLTVGNGGQVWNGNAQFNQTGNTFSPYWYNFTMDANITTGQANQLYPPTNKQFFSDNHIAINVFDIESFGAFTLAHFDMNSDGWVIPTGNATMSANNYTLVLPYIVIDSIPPFVHTYTGSYRGTAYYGTTGSAQLAYIRMNSDATTISGKIPNQGALIEINADSYFGVIANPITTSSRIATTGGRNQSFATYENSVSAGDFGIWPVNTNICEMDMYCPIGYLGGGTTTNRVRGGTAGARNDMTAEGTVGGFGTEMNIYSTDRMYLYTNGDLYIGFGGQSQRYNPTNSVGNNYQHVHISQVQDITGRTDNGDNGAQIVNINSIQGYTSNSFIKNFSYLIGYDSNFHYPNDYRITSIKTVSSLILTPLFISTVSTFSSAIYSVNGSNFEDSLYPYISTIDLKTSYVSSFFLSINYIN